MARLLGIAQLGQPVIRQKAAEVTAVKSPQVQALIDDMLRTVADADGVGIAANQVYESKRIAIISSQPTPRYPEAPKMEPVAVINPEILWHSVETEKDWEGCLSIPGIRALVPRYSAIRVSFLSRSGDPVELEYGGFVARVFQHEFDHLEGIVFLDRVLSSKEIVTEKEWRRLVARNDAHE